jgi:hypothetical protein
MYQLHYSRSDEISNNIVERAGARTFLSVSHVLIGEIRRKSVHSLPLRLSTGWELWLNPSPRLGMS